MLNCNQIGSIKFFCCYFVLFHRLLVLFLLTLNPCPTDYQQIVYYIDKSDKINKYLLTRETNTWRRIFVTEKVLIDFTTFFNSKTVMRKTDIILY